MKRWWIFCYDCYYPGGGMCDFEGAFETKEEAIATASVILAGSKELVYIQDDGTPAEAIEL